MEGATAVHDHRLNFESWTGTMAKLEVWIKSASKLTNTDTLGKSDPYVIVLVNGEALLRTKTIKNDLNPIWDDKQIIDLPDANENIQFVVYDEDRFRMDDLMGQAVMKLESLEHDIYYNRTIALRDFKNNETGYLHVSLKLV